jgi:hypothetical protein
MVTALWLGTTATADAQTITRGPYLQMGSHDRIVVRWRTNEATNSQVSYGLCHGQQSCLTWVAVNPTVTTEHEVTLTGLSPKTRYYYAVGSTTEQLAGNDSQHFFLTSPRVGESKATRIWVLGDSGSANANARAVRDAYYKHTGSTHTDLWLMLGDNAYNSGTDSEYQAAVFNMYPEMLRKSVLWPTLGNHDGASSNSGTQTGPYYESFTLPKKAEAGGIASGTEAYYSFDYGNIHFIVLDSFDSSRSPTGAMLKWLRSDLQATHQQWIIAYWHHPPYSKGTHDSDTQGASREMRQNALPILEDYGVDLVLSGHSHNYERSFLLNGHYGTSATLTPDMILDGGDGRTSGTGAYKKPSDRGAVYTVAGSSGKTGGGSLDHPAMFVSLSVLGSVVLNVNGSRLDAKFIRSNGTVQDEFTIQKGPTPRDIDVTPDSHSYGSVAVGTSEVQTFTIRNVGGADLKVSSTKLTGGESSEFAVTSGGGSFTLKPGATRNLEVAFEPSSTGPKDTTLRVESNDSDEKRFEVPLSGTGAGAGEIDVAPQPHDYAEVVVGTTNSQTFTIRNLGGADLEVTGASLVGGDAKEFAIVQAGTPVTLGPDETHDLEVRFAPVSGGNKTTALRLASNDPNHATYDVTLTGTGRTEPDLDVALTPLDFGDVLVGSTQSRSIAIRNTGSALLQVTAVSLPGGEGSEFTVTQGAPFTVAPAASHNIEIRFAPISAGLKTISLRISSDDPDESAVDVSLRGTGTTAPEIDVALTPQNYGVVWVGASASRALAVRNIGTADLQVNAISLVGGQANEFAIAPPSAPFRIAPGATHSVDLRFVPASAGTKATTMRLVSDDANEGSVDVALAGTGIMAPDIEALPAIHDYGEVTVGSTMSRTFVFSNAGGADLQVSSVSLLGGEGEFAIAAGVPGLVAAGGTFNVEVQFGPMSSGPKSTLLRLTSNDPDEPTLDVVLNGIGAMPAHIDVAPASQNFGEVILGRTVFHTFVIRNLGGTDLQVTATSVIGDQAADFVITQGAGPFLVHSGATHAVDLQFGPVAAGTRMATLQVTTTTDGESIVNVPVSGTGITPPEIDVMPTLQEYGEVLVGTIASRSFVIRNLGGAALHVTGSSFIGSDSHEFAVEGTSTSVVVLPGASHQLDVRFTPTSSGSKAATLQLMTDDPDEPLVDLAVNGVGTLLIRDIAVSPETHGYGSHTVGTNSTHAFVVMNTGTANLIVGGPTLTGPDADSFSLVSGHAGFTIAPGASHTIEVRFNPLTGGPKSAVLSIPSDDPDENPFLVQIVGTTPPTFEEVAQGGSADSDTVTTATMLSGVTGHVYLAAVSTKPFRQATAMSGLGLTWNRLSAQCAGRSQTGLELWWAQGSASSGEITATLATAPINAVLVVARYSGVAAIDPLTALVAGNTNGVNGACTDGTDSAAYSFDVAPSQNNTVVFGVLALRHRTHVPEPGYSKLAEVTQGTGGDVAGVVFIDRTVPVATPLPFDGSLDGSADWALIGVELKPQ